MPIASAATVFGRVLTAMVTPLRPDGSLDVEAAARLAAWLVDRGNDGLVLNGTTGEAPTTSDAEKSELIRAVKAAVGGRCRIVAGVGTNDTAHTLALTKQAVVAGADALLVVTPYYNKPPQEGLIAHFMQVADASDLPCILYDIPGRSGIPIAVESMLRLAEHPRIQAVKDAKGDFWAATQVLRSTDLAWYSGNDADNFLHLAQGGVGLIGVTSHVASPQYARMVEAVDAGDLATARQIHQDLVPAVDAVMNITQGAMMSKAALVELGVLEHPTVRMPLIDVTTEQRHRLRRGLEESGLL